MTKTQVSKIIKITFLAIVAMLLFFYLKPKKDRTDYSKLIQPTPTTSTSQANNNKPPITINCPDIKNITNKPLQEEINLIIKKRVDQIVTDYNLEEGAGDPQNSKNNWLEVECTPIRSDNSIFSIKLNINSYGGGAHPNHSVNTLNYSVKDQRELKLKDIFMPNSDYLKLLSQFSEIHLKEKLEDDYSQMIKDGTSPEEANFSNFLINENGLTIIFDPYQVAPYSEGAQQILIPSLEMRPDYLY